MSMLNLEPANLLNIGIKVKEFITPENNGIR